MSVRKTDPLDILRKETGIAMQFDFSLLKDSPHFCNLPLVGKSGPKFCALGFGKTESDAKYFRVGPETKCEFSESPGGFVHFDAKVLSRAKVIVNESNRKILQSPPRSNLTAKPPRTEKD
jgi:hypothetical protein